MPFIRPPKPRRATPKPPRKAKDKGASPWSVSPEWEAEGELPNLRDKDTFPLPWGGQIEHTLSRPIDPLNCEAWPSSPYCDISSTFDFSSFAGIDIEVSANPCGGVVRVQPRAFWLNLAPQTIVYRRDAPECQIPGPEPERPPPSPYTLSYTPIKRGHWDCIFRVVLEIATTGVLVGKNESKTYYDWTAFNFWGPLEAIEVRVTPSVARPSGQILYYSHSVLAWTHGDATFFPSSIFSNTFSWAMVLGLPSAATEFNHANSHLNQRGLFDSGYFKDVPGVQFKIILFEEYGQGMTPMPGMQFSSHIRGKIQYNQGHCKPRKIAEPPLLPALPDENMCNCKQMESDLKAIKRLLGADKGGWKLPKSLSGRGTEQVSHDNYADLMIWFAGQMSALLGDTEIVITQKDSSLLEEGNQERQLRFENLAEAMADALGLLLENQAKVDAIYRAAAQGLAQAGVAATSAAKGLEYLEDVVDFLDYETEEKSFDFPLFFTPDKDVPHEALKPSTAKLVYQAFTGKRSFNSFRFTMEQCAAIIRAVYWQRVDDDSIKRFEGTMDSLRQSKKWEDGSENTGDLDTWIERVEQGFPEAPGNVEQSQPYGAPYGQRPKIRKLSKGGGQDGGNP